MRRTLPALTALALVSLAWAAPAMADTPAATPIGFFGGFDLSVTRANFDVPSDDSAPEIGGLLGFHAGWRPTDALGLSAGFTGASYGFPIDVQGNNVDVTFDTDMFDLSAWLFVPVGQEMEVHLRGGLGWANAQLKADAGALGALAGAGGLGGLGALGQETQLDLSPKDKSGLGAIVSGGLDLQLTRTLRLYGEVNFRFMDVDFSQTPGFEDNHMALGAALGLGWNL